MTYYIHINRGVIDSNRKHGTDEPPVSFRKGKSGKATYAHEIELSASTRVIYDAHKPLLKCGARLVIVSETEPKIIR